jgi:hypothetical protein
MRGGRARPRDSSGLFEAPLGLIQFITSSGVSTQRRSRKIECDRGDECDSGEEVSRPLGISGGDATKIHKFSLTNQ